ncbi:unnamed protein product [Rotaria socialis]|uniref:Opine dehydrogenase domain-containing protein n=1 Tax=Rotaria socialis TaxID=392032 RepID=A0A820VWC8_9BILA|nr:unnamed protein product [Rotaria socialis]CAF4507449.1 unnamed protein product [Rotaria socialis]
MIEIILRSLNAFIHPTLMYARWKDWDGNALEHLPILYHDIEEYMAALLAKVSEEIGITYPMIKTETEKYIPDFKHRFLTEDVLFGLLVIRSIAEMVGVSTPCMDEVLTWCQQKICQEYLVGSKLITKNLATTRCPQRYGLITIAQILRYYSKNQQTHNDAELC